MLLLEVIPDLGKVLGGPSDDCQTTILGTVG